MSQPRKVFTLSNYRDMIVAAEIVKETPKRIYYRLPADKFAWGLSIARLGSTGLWSRRFFESWDSAKAALVDRAAQRVVRYAQELRAAEKVLRRVKGLKRGSVLR